MAVIKTGTIKSSSLIEEGSFKFFDRSNFFKPSNIYSHDGEFIIVPSEGNISVQYVNGKFAHHQKTYRIIDNRFLTKYLFYFLIKNKNYLILNGTTVQRANIFEWEKVLKNFFLDKKNQQQIIDIIEPLELLKNNILNQINQINIWLKNVEITNQKIKLENILEPIKNIPKNLEQVSAKVLMKNSTLISNLEKKGTYSTNSFFCPKGTFLFCSIRTYLQKYCLLPLDADVNGTLFQFKIKENFTSLLKALKSKEFWDKASLLSSGTKMPIILKKDFLNIEIKKTKFELKSLDELLIIKNKMLITLEKLKENLIKLLIK